MASGSSLTRECDLSAERRTMIERIVGLTRLPYPAGCLLVVAILGPVGSMLFLLADTLDFGEALRILVSLYPESTPSWQIFAGQALLAVSLFMILYLIRYMRTTLVAAKPILVSLSPQGKEAFHSVFARVSSLVPPVTLSVPLLFVPIGSIIFGQLPTSGSASPVRSPGLFSTLGFAFGFSLLFFAVSTFLWVYFSSIFGMHKLGKMITLSPFYDDSMLGVRPIGSLSLSLAFAYFLGLGSFLLLFSFNAPIFSTIVFGTGLVLVGLVMFFLPLYSLHKRMLAHKQQELAVARSKLVRLLTESNNTGSETPRTSLEDLKSLFRIDMARKEISSLPTWPFDTSILRRLIAIVLSLAVILLARLIALVLRI